MNRKVFHTSRKIAGALAILLFMGCELGSPTKGGGTEGEGVVGNLVDPSGAPMAGVWVKAYPLSGPANLNALTKPGVSTAVVESVQTTASGTYRFPGLASGTYNLVATTTQNGTKLALLIQSVIVTDGSATVGVDTVRVSGSVTFAINANGLNVEGALCFLEASPWSAVSDQSGTCTLTGLPPGVLQLNVSHPAFESIATQVASVVSGIVSTLGSVILAGEATARHTFILHNLPDSIFSATSPQSSWGLNLRRIVMKAGGVVLKDTAATPRFTPGTSIPLLSEEFGAAGGDTVEILVYGRVEGGPFDLMSGWDTTKPLYRGTRGLTIADRFIDTLPIELVWVGPSPAPAAPKLIFLETTVAPLSDTLRWTSVPSAKFYHLQLSSDSLFNSILVSDTALNGLKRSYGPVTPGTYYWRVRARNEAGYGLWSAVGRFVTVGGDETGGSGTNYYPPLSAPAENAMSVDLNPTFQWTSMFGGSAFVYYRLQVSTDTAFIQRAVDDSVTASLATGPVVYSRKVGPLSPNTTYFWRVLMVMSDSVSTSSTRRFTTIDTTANDSGGGASPTTYFTVQPATLALWTFDSIGSSNMFPDASGRGNHLPSPSQATLSTSPFGKSVSYNGSKSTLTEATLSLASNARFTLEARIWLDAYPASTLWNQSAILIGQYSGVKLFITDMGRIGAASQSGNGTNWQWYSPRTAAGAVPLGQWVDVAIAAERENSALYVYVNGVAQQLYTEFAAGSQLRPSSAAEFPFVVGNDGRDNQPFPGRIDEVRVSNDLVLGTGPSVIVGASPGP